MSEIQHAVPHMIAICNIALWSSVITEQTGLSLPEACNYLLVYEYVITEDFKKDTWGGMKRAIATRGIHDQSTGDASANRTLLLGGRKDGSICVFNWETGAIDFNTEVMFHKNQINIKCVCNGVKVLTGLCHIESIDSVTFRVDFFAWMPSFRWHHARFIGPTGLPS